MYRERLGGVMHGRKSAVVSLGFAAHDSVVKNVPCAHVARGGEVKNGEWLNGHDQTRNKEKEVHHRILTRRRTYGSTALDPTGE